MIIINTSFNEGNITYSIKENSEIIVDKIGYVSLFIDGIRSQTTTNKEGVTPNPTTSLLGTLKRH